MRSPQLVEIPGFQVAGISVITTNQDMQAAKDIGALWNKFFNEHISEMICGRLKDDLYCLYSDYEKEDRGSYRTLIGYMVSAVNSQPAGITVLEVPPLRYQVYVSEGDLGKSVIETWTRIWKAGLKRRFIVDFDLYPASADTDGEHRAYTYVSF
jgi:predicted transcriptional regulator YdeE